MMQRLDLTDNERAILITALRRLVDFGPLSPQTQTVEGDPRTAGAAEATAHTRYGGHRLNVHAWEH
jgi:hypothetical protein